VWKLTECGQIVEILFNPHYTTLGKPVSPSSSLLSSDAEAPGDFNVVLPRGREQNDLGSFYQADGCTWTPTHECKLSSHRIVQLHFNGTSHLR